MLEHSSLDCDGPMFRPHGGMFIHMCNIKVIFGCSGTKLGLGSQDGLLWKQAETCWDYVKLQEVMSHVEMLQPQTGKPKNMSQHGSGQA